MKIVVAEVPVTLNRFLRLHWTRRRQETERWKAIIRLATRRYRGDLRSASFWGWHWGRPLEECPKRRLVKVRVYRRRPQDQDNAYGSLKPVLDALKRIGWIFDDSPTWLKLDFQELSANGTSPRTEISIETAEKRKEDA